MDVSFDEAKPGDHAKIVQVRDGVTVTYEGAVARVLQEDYMGYPARVVFEGNVIALVGGPDTTMTFTRPDPVLPSAVGSAIVDVVDVVGDHHNYAVRDCDSEWFIPGSQLWLTDTQIVSWKPGKVVPDHGAGA